MISKLELSTEPLILGETRQMRAWGEEPLSVAIECFVEPPQPPQLKPCAKCGTFPLTNGQPFSFSAKKEVFQDGRGYLRISLSDASGDRRSVDIAIKQTLAKEVADAIEFVTGKLRGGVERIDRRIKELDSEVNKRQKAANYLKGATLVTGILVATGRLPDAVVQVLGVVVLLIVGFDQTYANLDKLKILTTGRNTYVRLRREVQAVHDDQLVEVLQKKESEPKRAAEILIELNRGLMKRLSSDEQEGEDAIANKQFALLDRLSVKEPTKEQS